MPSPSRLVARWLGLDPERDIMAEPPDELGALSAAEPRQDVAGELAEELAEQLTEELTVQKVVFESLQDQTYDGVECDRAESQKEIARLESLLDMRRRANDEQQQPASLLPGSSLPADDEQTGTESRDKAPSPSVSTPSTHMPPLDYPNTWSRKSPAAVTPTQMQTGSDVWSSPASAFLPSQKRGPVSPYEGTPSRPAKSRRPAPADSSSTSSFTLPEVIDLTGDDAGHLPAALPSRSHRQGTQERKIRAEMSPLRADRRASPYPVLPPPSTLITGPANRFLATTNAPSLVIADLNGLNQNWTFPAMQPPHAGASSPYGSHLRTMPGTFNPASWLSPPVTPLHDAAVASSPHSAMPTTRVFGSGNGCASRAPMSSHGKPFNVLPSQQTGQPSSLIPVPRIFSWKKAPRMPGSGGMGLGDTIEKTSMFDYSTQLDADGNGLSDRLSNFLDYAYHDPNVSEKELDDLLQNIRPDMDIPAKYRDGTPPGLKSSLYPHQQLAVAWMKKMEEGTNKGGILADDMGLGKTISTMALMLARPPTNPRTKTTLIIGPLSLIRQWEEELERKTNLSHRMAVFVYHNRKASTEDLLKHDVVLTTYGTIAQELKRLEKFTEDHAGRNVDLDDRAYGLKFPLLHPTKASFYRVILDEAQCIKNKDTKTARACHTLKATHRWCLTGTPMMNGVLELFSLVHFLRIKPYCVWDQFRQAFGRLFGRKGDPKSVAMNRLRALLKAIMLRRKKDSKLDGKPILVLPPKVEKVVYAKLSSDEQHFYQQLEQKSQVQFSKYLREGTLGKNYSNILVLLLRMRQACCHPHLNLDVDEATTSGNSDDIIQLVKELDQGTIQRIKSIEAFECPICFDAVQCPLFFVPCGHDSCMSCITLLVENTTAKNLQAGRESDTTKCPVCRSPFDAKKCFTYEAFRRIHMPETIVSESESDMGGLDSGEDSAYEEREDEEVDSKGNLRGFIDYGEDDTDRNKPSRSPTCEPRKEDKGKKKCSEVKATMLRNLRTEAMKNRVAFRRYMRYLRKTWMPSAKVTECMTLLKTIHEKGEKTIVFSQWTLLLDLLEVAIWHEKLPLGPQRYDGTMSGDERAKAAKDFRDKPDVNVMLVSLRAGNAGLNLTAASNVIIMDPFWNPYIEMQAVDRAHRIGQMCQVDVYRILTRETVEDRIVNLQNRKKEMVEAALDESESMKIGRLNVNELRYLFNAHD